VNKRESETGASKKRALEEHHPRDHCKIAKKGSFRGARQDGTVALAEEEKIRSVLKIA